MNSTTTPQAAPASTARVPSFSPLYEQIRELLLERLRQGEWRPGDAIPSEMELAAQYKVSQGTVRKAVDELAADNLLVRRQGRGTFVASHVGRQAQYRFLRLRADHGGDLVKETAEREIIHCEPVQAADDIAEALRLPVGSTVLHVRRLLRFAGVPTILEDVWLPAGPFQGLTAQRLQAHDGSMYALFEAGFSVHMVRADEEIRALQPGIEDAALLQAEPTTPLLSVRRVAYTYGDVPMELRHGLYRTDRHCYHNQLN